MNILKMTSKLLLFVTLFISAKCCGDFYWRDYEGIIPTDAIPGGKQAGRDVYIGQAYLHKIGLLVGTIVPGRKDLYFTVAPGRPISSHIIIKILCAHDHRKYYWLPTTRSTYKADTWSKCPVLAGYDQRIQEALNRTLGTLHIGRTPRNSGDTIVANIAAYDPTPWFFYPILSESGQQADVYEVLIYSDNPVLVVG